MEVFKKLKDLIQVSFSAEEQSQLAAYAKPMEVKCADVTTVDGKKLSIKSETPQVGSDVMDMTSGSEMPCADGEYTLEDGTVLKVMAGKIAEIATPSAETEEQKMAREAAEKAVPQLAQMSVQFSALKEENEKLKSTLSARLAEIEKKNQFLAETLNKVLEAPVQLSAHKNIEVPDFSKMTASEERAWKRANLGIN